jgi:hypothetical protein
MALEGRKVVQEFCPGIGKVVLKRVSNSASSLQNHFGSLPKDRDGISIYRIETGQGSDFI